MSTMPPGTRLDGPELPTGQLLLQPPPRIDRGGEGASGALVNAIPMLGSIGSIALVATMGPDTGGRSHLAAAMFLFATLAFVGVQLDRQRRQRSQRITRSRTAYLRHLGRVRQQARGAADQQRRSLTWQHPHPSALPALAEERTRLWERSTADDDFLHVRYGVCSQPLAVELVPPGDPPTDDADPAAASALHRLLVLHGTQPGLPASIDLRAFDRVEVCGAPDAARAHARAVVCSATAFHSPDHLVVAVLSAERNLVHWDWLKWLPHARSRRESDAVGPMRMVTTTAAEIAALLPADLADRPGSGTDEPPATPHVLLVNDGARLRAGHPVAPLDGRHGVTVLDLSPPSQQLEGSGRLRLQMADGEAVEGRQPVRVVQRGEQPVPALADRCGLATAEAFARRLAPLHATTGRVPGGRAAIECSDFPALLGVGDVATFEPQAAWQPRPVRERLRLPIGVGEGGTPVQLDLKEAAQQGMGPHGLVIGATGSGKSELLRTLVLGLAMTHSPQQLTMVLVDFKGGATFAGLSPLPHVSAVITNLADELPLVDRMQDALAGEMVRRQEELRAAGNFASVRDYERARDAGADLPPLPSLLVVVDEFSELLAAKPELTDLFVAIGRVGRSLGLHLLLASQRLEEGRLRGLDSHLSYRVGLRTFSAGESRSVIGVPDAYGLPPVPGVGYLRPDPHTLVRFTSAYVSAPPNGRTPVSCDEAGRRAGILPFTLTAVRLQPDGEPRPAAPEPRAPAALLDLAVARMADAAPAARQIWLPPLARPDTIDRLLTDLTADAQLGLVSPQWRRRGRLVVPIGTVDRPREQRRDPMTIDLGGAAGHVAVVGGPRSGKSTLLRTIVASLALTTTPLESQFFVIDLGGGTFAPLRRLPHVAGVGTRDEPDVVRRVVAQVRGVIDRRESYFRDQGIDTMETYRSRRAEGRADDGYGDVFLVVDGWSGLRVDFDDLEVELQHLAARGLGFGLHLLTGAARWADFRAAVRDLFGTRLELRLGDPMDSEINRTLAARVPPDRPGHGITRTGHHFLAALPRIDADASPDSLGAGLEDLVDRVAAAWPGPDGPELRLLPERIGRDRVLDRAGTEGSGGRLLLLGLDERELAPVGLDVDVEPHLLVFGEGGSGKSTILRGYLREVIRTRTAREAQVVLVDHRRSLLGEVPEEYLLHHLASAAQAQPALADLAAYLAGRLPGPDATPEQLRSRSWWSGAEVFVVVDDYDLVATSQGSPVQALQPFLAQARDVGLHVVVARRSGGASRALYEPVIQTLRDLAVPGLLLSGSPGEGPLLGELTPARALPGRGRLLRRDRGVEVLQTAWTEPATRYLAPGPPAGPGEAGAAHDADRSL